MLNFEHIKQADLDILFSSAHTIRETLEKYDEKRISKSACLMCSKFNIPLYSYTQT